MRRLKNTILKVKGDNMPIDAFCPKCSSSLTVPDEFAGKMIRCGGCSDTFIVTLPPPLPFTQQAQSTSQSDQPPALPSQVNSISAANTETVAKPAERLERPVAKAVTPSRVEQRREVDKPFPQRPEDKRSESRPVREDAPPKSSLGVGLMIMAGVLFFICSGLGVVGYSIWKLATTTESEFSKAEPGKDYARAKVEVNQPKPTIKTIEKADEKEQEKTDNKAGSKNQPKVVGETEPSKNPSAPPKNAPALPTVEPPSPVGMKDLVMYSSFDTSTVRDEISREKIEVDGLPSSLAGKRKKSARLFCRPSTEDTPEFAADLGYFVSNFQMKEDSAWTIMMWVAVPTSDGLEQTVFSLCQSSSESAPQLNIRVTKNQLAVVLNCDKKDSEKSFVRSKNINVKELVHVAISRSTKGKLSVYFNGEEETTAPSGSLSADQPVAMSFKYAGFGKRSEKKFQLIVDEFAYFQAELPSGDIKKMAGR
jgi:hypothetical protein